MQAAAQAFEGTYTAGLQWRVEPRTELAHTPVELQDSVQLTIAYGGGKASLDCSDLLKVPVLVTLTTTDSGLAESGQATLEIWRSSQGLEASLRYESARVRLAAEFPLRATGGAPLVNIDALDPALPGASATFTEEP